MPVNRNALIRYRTIDRCLRNRYRPWTLEDLIEACSDALYEYEGIDKGVSRRTVQADLEVMRSGKLGYEAPIVVIDRKFYSYSDKDFSITNIPLTPQDLVVLSEASALLKQFKGLPHSADLGEMITKLEDKIHAQKTHTRQVVDFERNDHLRGLHWIEKIRQYIVSERCFSVMYKSFKARSASIYPFSPYLLKEFRNRWFVLGTAHVQHQTIQTLALDRIELITDCMDDEATFIPNEVIDIETYYDDVIGVTRNLKSNPAKVVFKANKRNAPYIQTKPLHRSQKVIRDEEDGVVFSIDVVLNTELERELLGFGGSIEVLSPQLLRRRIKDNLTTAVKHYTE
ncbi:MAG TPA: WYL domain-containing protein [Bacteroidetes bacterium]|nr:WYL domain-containing protein [Bacteroidota bacterium]HRK05112.1 WYL domain-containing protein [Chlorobiota bacterium]